MDWSKASGLSGIGTFVLTLFMLAIMLWRTLESSTEPLQMNLLGWFVPLAVAGMVIAAFLHWKAARLVTGSKAPTQSQTTKDAKAQMERERDRAMSAERHAVEAESCISKLMAREGTLALRTMIEDCGWFLNVYRELDQNHRDQVRLPLHPASWPEFGKPWEYVHCMLHSLSIQLRWFLLKAEKVWQELGWEDTPALFRSGRSNSTLMAHLIADLEELLRRLEQRVASLNLSHGSGSNL